MESKDAVTLIGIGATFLVSAASLAHSLYNDKRSVFVNTVTSSRLKWIDSLRDQVSEYLAVTGRLLTPEGDRSVLLLRRDTLAHQVVLHLNPRDPADQRITALVTEINEITNDAEGGSSNSEAKLLELRNATAAYLKKEWNRVKAESGDNQKS